MLRESLARCIAGPATDCGQKVHNLRVAVAKSIRESEVLVFVDTDARPGQQLAAIISSRRWPMKRLALRLVIAGSFPSVVVLLRGSARSLECVDRVRAGRRHRQKLLLGWLDRDSPHDFESLNVSGRVARNSFRRFHCHARSARKQNCRFISRRHCLVASVGDCDLSELFEFTTRQIKITRVYAPHLWLPLLLGSALFVLRVFFGGLSC